MHQWDYDHSTGEDAMAWQLAKHGSTHQARENTTFVPFREAFADWVAHRLLIEITGGEVRNFLEDVAWKYPELPLARPMSAPPWPTARRSWPMSTSPSAAGTACSTSSTYPYLDRCDFNRSITDSDPEFCFVAIFSTQSNPEVRTGYSLQQV